jgi:hypothetical protein
VLAIFLGWKLYKDAVLSAVSGEAELSGTRFKLAAAGPGVFFALFGMWLLVKLVDRPLELEDAVPVKAPINRALLSEQLPTGSAAPVLLAQARDRNPPGFWLTQASQDESRISSADCLVIKSKRVLFAGHPLTASAVDDALSTAIAELKLAERAQSPETDPAASKARLRALDTLNQMKEGVVK